MKYREARRLRREMTDSERALWARLRRNQILGMHFRRQHVILGFIADFFCRKAKLALEVDGGIHRDQIKQDCIRDEILKSKGILVLRISNEKIATALDDVVKDIINICGRRINLLKK